MKLKNIESIDELKVGDWIVQKDIERTHRTIIAKCDGAVMINNDIGDSYVWVSLAGLILNYQIQNKSEEWVPKEGDVVWRVDFWLEEPVEDICYHEDYTIHQRLFRRGLIFQTKEEAIACAKKMLEAIKK